MGVTSISKRSSTAHDTPILDTGTSHHGPGSITGFRVRTCSMLKYAKNVAEARSGSCTASFAWEHGASPGQLSESGSIRSGPDFYRITLLSDLAGADCPSVAPHLVHGLRPVSSQTAYPVGTGLLPPLSCPSVFAGVYQRPQSPSVSYSGHGG